MRKGYTRSVLVRSGYEQDWAEYLVAASMTADGCEVEFDDGKMTAIVDGKKMAVKVVLDRTGADVKYRRNARVKEGEMVVIFEKAGRCEWLVPYAVSGRSYGLFRDVIDEALEPASDVGVGRPPVVRRKPEKLERSACVLPKDRPDDIPDETWAAMNYWVHGGTFKEAARMLGVTDHTSARERILRGLQKLGMGPGPKPQNYGKSRRY